MIGTLKQATLGVLGGGQLGKMLCQSAQSLGFKTIVLDNDPNSPAGLIAHQHIQAPYNDIKAIEQLQTLCDAITTEFENVPADVLQSLEAHVVVSPKHESVRVCQDRTLEKQWFKTCGIPCADNVTLNNIEDCGVFIQSISHINDNNNDADSFFPAILKTAQLGYDGKGQVSVQTADDLIQAFESLGNVRCVLEKKMPLRFEVSVIVARSNQGHVVHLPVQYNHHIGGILAVTQVPAQCLNEEQTHRVIQFASTIVEQLNYVGVLCVEFFVLNNGKILANELAPRPHNSGHYSIEACDISQYDLQVRTLAQLPLIQPKLIQSAVMVNILGDVWFNDSTSIQPQEPNWAGILSISGASLHLYGKTAPKRGRKMGHITITADTLDLARDKAKSCCTLLGLTHYFDAL